jgi:hypothetical protein
MDDMILQKWDFNLHEYLPYEVPNDKNIVLFSRDMELRLDCTNCFRVMVYGHSYTSLTIHNELGLGYPVCADCYAAEEKLSKEARNATTN